MDSISLPKNCHFYLPYFSNPPKSTNTKINTTCGQQPKSQSTVNQRQQPVKQHNTLTPPSTERTGPEGEADEEEPSEVMLR